jgi:hypothetical protein
MHSTFAGVPDSAVIALASLVLKRARLVLPCVTRQQAINIIRSVKPAPSRTTPLNIKPCNPKVASICRKCGKPIAFGEACRTFAYSTEGDEHITCPQDLAAMYDAAIRQIS